MITTNYDNSVKIENTELQGFIQDVLEVAKTGSYATSDVNENYAVRNIYGHYSVTLLPVVEKPVKPPHHFSKAAQEAKAKLESEKIVVE